MHPLIEDLLQTPYGFHCFIVATVVSSALLVYLCGFKSAVEPPFDKLSYPGADERRQQSAKKKKPKDKKSQSNGHATSVGSDSKKSEQKLSSKKDEKEKSPSKQGGKNSEEKRSPAKNALRETKGARQQGKGKENVEQVKNKKNQVEEKPKDFDDGELP
ncbi:hypothetical protein AAG570_013368 [Ranatra chinensis]|uniref:Uncharacterized protein n=1 Tax=Ranatra chinensis TaxID=642074 RepID=A0ABD0Z073_9HEMI